MNSTGCVHGFKTLPDLIAITGSQYLGTEVEPLNPSELRLFLPAPLPFFTCGGYVTSWTVGVQIGDRDINPSPELQIWRLMDEQYQKQDSTSISRDNLISTPHEHVYDVIDIMRFEPGDFIGLYQPPNSTDQFSETRLHYVVSDRWNIVTFSDNSVPSLEAGILVAPACDDPSLNRCTTPLVTARVGEDVYRLIELATVMVSSIDFYGTWACPCLCSM